jgi:sec-independent protein translocase protein TatA
MFGTLAYIGTTEIWIIAGVVILLFGGAKMAQFGKGLGESIREFRKAMTPEEEAAAKAAQAESHATTAAPTATTKPVEEK